MSGVMIDEARDRMIILYKTHRGDMSMLETPLREIFLDDGVTFPETSLVNDMPATNLTTPIRGAVDDTGVSYIVQDNGNVNCFDLNDGIALPLATFSAGVAVTDVTIFRGVVLLAHTTGATRGLRAYALRNRKYTKASDITETSARQARYPLGGENPLDLPITITQNGICLLYTSPSPRDS